jgi:hypothetical protein
MDRRQYVGQPRQREERARPFDRYAPFLTYGLGLDPGPEHPPSGQRDGQGEPDHDAVQQIDEDDADCGHYVDGEIPMLHCGFDVSRLQQLNSDDDEQTGECCGGESFSGFASDGRIGVVSTF